MNYKKVSNTKGKTTVKKRVQDASSSESLKQRVLSLGLDPTGKSVKQMEALIAMAEFARDYPGEEFPDQFDPMLAEDGSTADKDWIDKVYNSNDYIIQEKKNGMHSILNISSQGKVSMTARARSVKNFMFTPHHENVLGFYDLSSPFTGKTTFAGELMSPKAEVDTGATITSSPLQAVVALVHMNTPQSLKIQEEIGSLEYHAFDILFFDGEDVQHLPFQAREELVATAVAMLKKDNPDLPITPIESHKSYTSAYELFKEFEKNGSEGIMMKLRKGKYQQGKRSKDVVKLKGQVTVDGFITGFVNANQEKGFKGQIGGFKISAYVDGKVTEIAAISNIPNDIRKDATLNEDGVISLNPEYINKCVELVGQEWSKSRRLGSARINEWRPDKNPEDCQLTKEDIEPKTW